MLIRKVDPVADSSEICRIYNHYITETVISFETEPLAVDAMIQRIKSIVDQGLPYLVCEEDGIIVGFSYAHKWKERPAYSTTLETTVYLDVAQRHRGYGNALMVALIDMCRAYGSHSLIACITAENYESVAFHRSLGFMPVSMFRQVGYKFGRFLDVTDLQLIL